MIVSGSLNGVHWWDNYWGQLAHDGDDRFPSTLYGFETVTPGRNMVGEVPAVGACFGFVSSGAVIVRTPDKPDWRRVGEQAYFSTSNGAVLELEPDSRVVLMQALGYLGQDITGGRIEPYGRLKYIDSCSDTLLIGPPTFGDPCLNHLHFPAGVFQTAHSHPSTRYGIVARGSGRCRGDDGLVNLVAGRLFYICRGANHAFVTTDDQSMDVIAYHPDTDFGPTHQDHPMVNRTLIGGLKIDNRAGVHQQAQVIVGRGGVAFDVW
jgi:hypothetical protein